VKKCVYEVLLKWYSSPTVWSAVDGGKNVYEIINVKVNELTDKSKYDKQKTMLGM
jgi:hypothetical protein